MNSPSDFACENIERLLAERAISRVLLRYCRAVDRADIDLLSSTFHPDASIEHGPFVGSAKDFCELHRSMAGPSSPYKSTQHLISNIVIDLGEDWANAESYVQAYHRREDSTGVYDEFVGARYLDRLERRHQCWKIAARKSVFDWSRVEPGTPQFWEQFAEPSTFLFGSRSLSDPLYAFAAQSKRNASSREATQQSRTPTQD